MGKKYIEFTKLINQSPKITKGIINKNIISYFKQMTDEKMEYNHSIWRIISFTKWIEKFKVKI